MLWVQSMLRYATARLCGETLGCAIVDAVLALDQQPSVQQSYLARGCQQLPTHEVVLRCSIVAFDRDIAVENLLDALEDVAESVSLVPGLGPIVQEDES